MSRKEAKDGAKATIDRVFPEANPIEKKRLVTKLKTYASSDYRDEAFPEGMGLCDYTAGTERGSVCYRTKGDKYFRNLLELDSLVGNNKKTLEILWKRDRDSRKSQRAFLTELFGELRYRADRQLNYADHADQLLEVLLGDRDPTKECLFPETPVSNTANPPAVEKVPDVTARRSSFVGLGNLERIALIERDEKLSEAQRYAKKAILYLEMNNSKLALKLANKALATDKANGYAWMVIGFLSLKEMRDAFRSCAVYNQELAASSNSVSAEGQWLQELQSDAVEQGVRQSVNAANCFLNAWSFWPADASGILVDSNAYKQKLIIAFFQTVSPKTYDKDLLRQTIEKDFNDLKLLCLSNVSLFLKAVLPTIHSVTPDRAAGLASYFVEHVKRSTPAKDGPNPPDPTTNALLLAAAKNLEHLQSLSQVLPFAEVEAFMKDVFNRCKELEEISKLKSLSMFYLNRLKGLETREAIGLCSAALNTLPFTCNRAFDGRLKKQWQYLYLSSVIRLAIDAMLYKKSGGPGQLASLLAKSITPELLDDVIGDDYFDLVEEYDNVLPDSEYKADLRGQRFNVLQDDIATVLAAICGPFRGDDLFEKLIAKWIPSYGGMCRSELLLLYFDSLVSGSAEAGYQEFLRSLEKSGRDINEAFNTAGVPKYKAIGKHNTFSLILSYCQRAMGLNKTTLRQLNDLKKLSGRFQSKRARKN